MNLRWLFYFKTLACHLIFLFIGCGNKLDYTWKSIDITVERGVVSSEGYFFSEKLKRKLDMPAKENKLATMVIDDTRAPFPIKIISARWKLINTYTDSSLKWGYQLDLENQLFLTNEHLKDSLHVGIRRITIELLDNDGFSVKKYNQSFNNEPLRLINESF